MSDKDCNPHITGVAGSPGDRNPIDFRWLVANSSGWTPYQPSQNETFMIYKQTNWHSTASAVTDVNKFASSRVCEQNKTVIGATSSSAHHMKGTVLQHLSTNATSFSSNSSFRWSNGGLGRLTGAFHPATFNERTFHLLEQQTCLTRTVESSYVDVFAVCLMFDVRMFGYTAAESQTLMNIWIALSSRTECALLEWLQVHSRLYEFDWIDTSKSTTHTVKTAVCLLYLPTHRQTTACPTRKMISIVCCQV